MNHVHYLLFAHWFSCGLGERGVGKRTFANSLFNSDVYDLSAQAHGHNPASQPPAESVTLVSNRAKIIEGDNELQVEVVIAEGYGEQVDNSKR